MTRGSDQPPKPANPQREFDAVWGDLVPEDDVASVPTPAKPAAPDEVEGSRGTKVWDDAARAEPLRAAGVAPAEGDEGFQVERSGKFLRTAEEEMALLMSQAAADAAESAAKDDDEHAKVEGEPERIDEPSDAIERHEVSTDAAIAVSREPSGVVSSAATDVARGELASESSDDDVEDEAPPPKQRPRVAVTPSSRPRPISSPVRVPLEPIGQMGGERRGIMLPLVLLLSLATGAWLLWQSREREPKPTRTAETQKVPQPATREGKPAAPEGRDLRMVKETAASTAREPAPPTEPAPETKEAPSEGEVAQEPAPAPPKPAPPQAPPEAPTGGDPRVAPPGTPPDIAEVFVRLPVSPADLPPVGGVGNSGIHVDRITTGSSYDKGNCGGSVDRFSVAEHDVVNVCMRVVHPRVQEEVQILWQRHGQSSSRRGKVAIKPIHAYRTRAYLKLRKEYVGDWTVKIVSQDGVELASHDFNVAE